MTNLEHFFFSQIRPVPHCIDTRDKVDDLGLLFKISYLPRCHVKT